MFLMVASTACAQTANQAPQPQSGARAQSGTPAAVPSAPLDSSRQIQIDLDQMEGLLNNMAAQVNFIRDTNMSILLNTNVRLWSVLIRDMRLQVQQQQRGMRPASAAPPQ
jgi:hypothetical protein